MSDLLEAARAALPGHPFRKNISSENIVLTNGNAWPRVAIYAMNDMPGWFCVDVDHQHFNPVQGEEAAARVARDAVTARRDALTAALGDGWIPVGERLPEVDKTVPLWTDRGFRVGSRGFVYDCEWLWADEYGELEPFADVTVTHWLDLQPPREGGK